MVNCSGRRQLLVAEILIAVLVKIQLVISVAAELHVPTFLPQKPGEFPQKSGDGRIDSPSPTNLAIGQT
jgi:hypothetical protein